MLKKNIVIFQIVIAIFLFSCVKTANIDIKGGENQIVVNATLCPDSAISLVLSKSKNVLDITDIEYVNSSNIYVYENNILVDTLKNKGNGKYIGNLKPIVNVAYTIKVKTISDQIAEGTDSIPELVKIQKIDTSKVFSSKSQLNCIINFTDPINRDNYYLIKILSADKTNPQNVKTQDYICYDSNIIGSLNGGNITIFNDSQFNGKAHSVVVSMPYSKNKKVYFQLWSISHTFYNYCTSLINNRANNGSLFAEQTQVISNVKGGLGIIGAYSLSKDSIDVE